jgi:hypothetical protein
MRKIFNTACLAAGVLAASFAGGPAMASDGECILSYQTFHAVVPHIDLEQCPADVPAKETFCRASLGDELHVFVFSEKGDRCLVTVRSYPQEKYILTIKN